MLEESFEHAEDDVHQRMLRETRVDAEAILHVTRAQLVKHAEGLMEGEETEIAAAMRELERAAAGDDPVAIRDAYDRLSQTSEPFARRIMDAALRDSVGGRVLEDL
jgi:molecular chaperone HscA